jgi:membrane associated rhomboid family serine protease
VIDPQASPERGKSVQLGRLRLQFPAISPENRKSDRDEPPFDPTSWSGALFVMIALTAVLYVVQIVNGADGQRLDRFGLRPRTLRGLEGIVTQPFLHSSWWQLISNTPTFIVLGWAVLLAGVRGWLIVTGLVMLVGGLATWLVASSDLRLDSGSTVLVFGWLGYLLARAIFSRRIVWIFIAIVIASFFSGLFGGLLPGLRSGESWVAHLCAFGAGIGAGWLLHPRQARKRQRPAVS